MLIDKLTKLERNRYFFGKLLTPSDFNCEQNYFITKRRLINRLLFGTGVVCGLTVKKTDDTTISIDSGIALDCNGKELVQIEPITKKLSDIEGFNQPILEGNQSTLSAYLCAEYAEELAEPTHSVAKTLLSDENEGAEFNKIRESIRYFIKYDQPKEHPNEVHNATHTTLLIFNDEGASIYLSAPKYVSPNDEFYITTTIIKGAKEQQISLNYKTELAFLTISGKHKTEFKFSSQENEERLAHQTETLARSLSSCEQATITIKDISVSIDGIKSEQYGEHTIHIGITKNTKLLTQNCLKSQNLNERLNTQQILYLARISLKQSLDQHLITNIKSLPFNQSILSLPQAQALLDAKSDQSQTAFPTQPPPHKDNQPRMSCGTISVTIPQNAQRGSKYFSKPTPHLLGIGAVLINAALSEEGTSTFGNGIFDDSLSYNIKVDKIRGLFTIGIKLKRALSAGEIAFDWFALKREAPTQDTKKVLSLYPDIYYACAHETLSYEIRLSEGRIDKSELIWSITPETGGKITKNGILTLSGEAGFYEITAKSRDEKLSASAFVVV